ncbi:MAG TPA: dihydroorotase [Acidobacteriota bacterium]|nr:dihydroorotase [Acidobacteriota bacterium]
MKLLFHGGRVVDPSQGLDTTADILVDNGKIARVGKIAKNRSWQIFDVSGLVLAPGFVDMHVHLREPGGERKETIQTGSEAAVAGGFTSIACMPNTDPVNDSPALTRYILERARQTDLVNVFPIGAVTRGSRGEELAEIGVMYRAGIVAVSDDGNPIQHHQLVRRALEYIKLFDIPLIDHCEDRLLAAGGCMNEGAVSTRLGLRGASRTAEELHVVRDVMLSRITGGRVHIAHVSARESLDWIRQGKRHGAAVTCEVTPHHFTLIDRDIGDYNTNFKMSPPLREREDVQAMLEGLADGTIDCIATDHAPHTSLEKDTTFEEAANGVIGLETAVSVAVDRLVHGGVISWSRLVELMSCNPSRILRLDRGTLRVGAIADITVIDPDRQITVDTAQFKSKSRNCPFQGWKLRGAPVMTVVSGRIVYHA